MCGTQVTGSANSTVSESDMRQLGCLQYPSEEQQKAEVSLENGRRQMQAALQSSLLDGRLAQVLASLRANKAAQQLDSLRQRARNSLHSLAMDGRLSEVVASIRQATKESALEKFRVKTQVNLARALRDGSLEAALSANQEPAVEHVEPSGLRQMLKQAFQAAAVDGRLSEAFANLKAEKQATELEILRQRAHNTLQISLLDGRLPEALATLKAEKQAKELETMRQGARSTLKISLLDGSLSEALATLKAEDQAKEVETLRQGAQSCLQSSLLDGRLSQVLAALKAERDNKELDAIRKSVKNSLQTALENGSLAEVVATVKADNKRKEIEAMRNSIKSIFEASLCDGRLSDVISDLKNERLAAQANAEADSLPRATETLSFETEAAAPKPAKPTSAKTTTRPTRRLSLRIGATPEAPSPAASEALPPRLPTPACGLGSSSARGPSTLSLHYLSEAAEPGTPKGALCSSPRARLHKLSRPASPVGALPPVTPPCKQAAPSAMMLDLEAPISLSTAAWTISDPDSKTSHTRSLSSLRVTKLPSKQAPSFLPAIGGLKGAEGGTEKLSARKRSPSMDSFVWGVAPLANKFVF